MRLAASLIQVALLRRIFGSLKLISFYGAVVMLGPRGELLVRRTQVVISSSF